MKIEFERDLAHNYVIPLTEETNGEEDYQVHMLAENHIEGLMHCVPKTVNCEKRYCYEITSRQSLEQVYETAVLKIEDLRMILRSLYDTLLEMEKYLLDVNRIVLEPELVYLDIETKKAVFCYLPPYEGDLERSFRDFTTFVMHHLDQKDPQAVLQGYEIYRLAMENNFSIQELLLKILDTGNAKQEKKTDPVIGRETGTEKEIPEADRADAGGDIRRAVLPEKEKEKSGGRKDRSAVKKDNSIEEKEKPQISKSMIALGAAYLITGVLIGLGVWLHVLTVTQAGGIAFLMAGLAGYLISSSAKQKEKTQAGGKEKLQTKSIQPPAAPSSPAGKAPESFAAAGRVPEPVVGATMVLSEGTQEYQPRMTLLSMNTRDRTSIVLVRDCYTVGKLRSKADICVDSPAISRLHAKIVKEDGDYYLCDTNSTNGTYRNGHRLGIREKVKLEIGDEITFADVGYYVGMC